MSFSGYAGRILEIDLSTEQVKVRFLDKNFAITYIGGRGFGARILWDHTDATTNPLSPENSSCVGIKTSFQQLIQRSEAIYNITRAINLRRGITRKDDYPPPRIFNDPVPRGPFRGKVLNKDKYEQILNLYYELRGWTEEGIPKKETLIRLGLEDLIEYI